MADDGDLTTEQTEKLVIFQDITHIDSIDECKQILEAFQWNIEVAVQNTFNEQPGTSSTQQNPTTSNTQPSTSISSSSSSSANSIFNTSFDNHATNDNEAIFYRNFANNIPQHPQPPRNLLNDIRSFNPPPRPQQQLPNVNVNQLQRTVSVASPRHNAIVPQGVFQWSMYLFSFPFRFLFATIVDLTSFFWSMFNTSSIPIDYDPLANIAEFAITYNQKYGTNHPQFYQGSYSQAVNEAKRDLKFLLIYIHQNDNKDCHLFASETLQNPEIIELINNTFIFWSCSKDLPEGQKVFNALKARRCPFLGVIVLKHSRSTLVSKIEGPITATELIAQLNNLIGENEHDLVVARLDRDERSQTQLLRSQQDEDYLESLKLDQEKAKQKQLLAEEKRLAQELEKQKLAEEKDRENNILNRKSELRQLLANTPQPDTSNELTLKLIIKLPNGNRFERFFLKTDPLSSLYKFVFCNEECPLNFEIVTNFPRKVIECTEDTTLSIRDFGITQSMILFVNDLDA